MKERFKDDDLIAFKGFDDDLLGSLHTQKESAKIKRIGVALLFFSTVGLTVFVLIDDMRTGHVEGTAIYIFLPILLSIPIFLLSLLLAQIKWPQVYGSMFSRLMFWVSILCIPFSLLTILLLVYEFSI